MNQQLALIPIVEPASAPLVAEDPAHAAAARLVALWLADNKTAATKCTYEQALDDFAGFLQAESITVAVAKLLTLKKGPATAILEAYRASLTDLRKLAPNSVNLRIAAMRSLLVKAYDYELIEWVVRIRGVKTSLLRDTRGPGTAAVKSMFDCLKGKHGIKAKRDRAILRLLWDLAMRRGEIVGLDVAHVDLDRPCIWCLGKGKRERNWMTLPPQTRAALAEWIEARGDQPGPLFVPLSNRR